VNAELESFNHTVSHDLRTPIRALAGFPDLLEAQLGDRLDAKGRQYLDAIRLAARRMAEITTKLLDFSRLGRGDLSMTDVDLSVLVGKVREDLAVMAAGRRITWQVADLPVVKGDAHLLRIALTNLLANAIKFTRLKEQAVIGVASAVGEDGIPFLTVKDNGAGFDMRYADRLFTVFSRLHPSEAFEGTGIGLATVSRIVRRHGGRIWAEGTPGDGASFSFTLAPSPLDALPPPPMLLTAKPGTE
jgi:light-regulated signal transduction histidine kinase (bacteriophytochrome)